MRYLVVSDLHGSLEYTKKTIELFNDFSCDFILCLGDILYHGPRNDLPNEYQPKEVINILNSYKDKILAVKGNCDAEVDEMVLEFPLKEKRTVKNGLTAYLTHGHKINPYNPILGNPNEIVFYGHTHISKIEKINGVYYINPGSISIPKDNNHSFAIFTPTDITIYDTNKQVLDCLTF